MHSKNALAILLWLSSTAAGQSLDGVIDIHAHSGPDSVPRQIDALDLAKLAKSRGMRGLVLKNHYESTAALAVIMVRKEVPGLEVFGGIDLNLSVGGMNPAAVERMAMMKGGFGRFVWIVPLIRNRRSTTRRRVGPVSSVSKNGELLPEVKRVIAVIAKNNLVMSTGHNTPAEDLMLIREGIKQGVKHIVVTHAMIAPIHMNLSQMQEASSLGAYVGVRIQRPDRAI